LWEETEFLLSLLKKEYVLQRRIDNIQQFRSLLDYMVEKQVL
jgi:hypothetical protein